MTRVLKALVAAGGFQDMPGFSRELYTYRGDNFGAPSGLKFAVFVRVVLVELGHDVFQKLIECDLAVVISIDC